MFHKNTLSHSLYATLAIVIITMTGIFGTFAGRTVIEDRLNFDTVILVVMLAGTGYLVAAPVASGRLTAIFANSMVGSLIVGVVLALLVILESSIDLSFMFQNLRGLNEGTLTFDRVVSLEDGQLDGLILLLTFSAACGIAAGLISVIPKRLREIALTSAGLAVVLALVIEQINEVIALPDALSLIVAFGLGYAAARRFANNRLTGAGLGAALGAALGILLAVIANSGGLDEGGILRGIGTMPTILELTVSGSALIFVLIAATAGAVGALTAGGSRAMHDGSLYFLLFVLVLGILNWQDEMSLLATIIVFAALALGMWLIPLGGNRADAVFDQAPRHQQRRMMFVFGALMLAILLVAPQFMGLYIANVFNLIALYTMMGIGLNVMIGFTGLLDLGYVASFAIGAYTLGVLTTPNVLTCGGVHPDDIPFDQLEAACTGMTTFWAAWPFSVFFSALTGMMLGIPVLRLRGDYLAIVTLGFGEIMNRIIRSNTFEPVLGGPQGISPIDTPELHLDLISVNTTLDNSTSIYYLFLFGVMVTAFVVLRLLNSRTGRAWRAVREDEDVAQAMGINTMWAKLLAFGVSSAFAGLGGAVFGASLQGIFPNSFTLLVSINVLSLIIIGGMGSIPGVVIGAMLLVGMPELLRELEDYRLLVFGALLVVVMLTKPEGLIPPQPPRLSERVTEDQQTTTKDRAYGRETA